jgi:4-hydroxybenzoyl-CoA thioesterase
VIFHHPIRVEFNHCDPAGIVFYPRYLEMVNATCENFFRAAVGYSYPAMMAVGDATPTAALEATFHAPARLGEMLDWQLAILRIGTSSLRVRLTAVGEDGQPRVTVEKTLVFTGAALRPQPWTPALRESFAPYLQA